MKSLSVGEVGYVVTGIRDVAEIKGGDTITLSDNSASEMLPPDTKMSVLWYLVVCIHLILLIMKIKKKCW